MEAQPCLGLDPYCQISLALSGLYTRRSDRFSPKVNFSLSPATLAYNMVRILESGSIVLVDASRVGKCKDQLECGSGRSECGAGAVDLHWKRMPILRPTGSNQFPMKMQDFVDNPTSH